MKKNNYWRERLKKWRKEKGLTQSQLAKIASISQSEISQLETGGRPFTQETIDKVLTVFKKDYNDLFGIIDSNTIAALCGIDRKRAGDTHDFNPAEHRDLPAKIIKLIKKAS